MSWHSHCGVHFSILKMNIAKNNKIIVIFTLQVKDLTFLTIKTYNLSQKSCMQPIWFRNYSLFTIWRPFWRPFWIFSHGEKSNDLNNIIFEFLDQNYIRLDSLSNFVALKLFIICIFSLFYAKMAAILKNSTERPQGVFF